MCVALLSVRCSVAILATAVRSQLIAVSGLQKLSVGLAALHGIRWDPSGTCYCTNRTTSTYVHAITCRAIALRMYMAVGPSVYTAVQRGVLYSCTGTYMYYTVLVVHVLLWMYLYTTAICTSRYGHGVARAVQRCTSYM